jgi:hypothetical protein
VSNERPEDNIVREGDDWIINDATRARRRTILHGAAWTIPAIAMAAAAPTAAASDTPPPCTNSRLVVVNTGYIRDSTDGWGAEMLSNSTGARLGIGWILPDSRMKAVITVRNPTDCDFRGTVRIQIDLPARTIGGGPTSEQGFAASTGGDYTMGGLTYRRYYFSGTVSVAAGQTYQMGVNWTLAQVGTLRTYLGAPAGPQRTSIMPATSGSVGWRLPNPPGTVNIDGAVAWSTPYNNTLAQNAGYWIHQSTAAFPT